MKNLGRDPNLYYYFSLIHMIKIVLNTQFKTLITSGKKKIVDWKGYILEFSAISVKFYYFKSI